MHVLYANSVSDVEEGCTNFFLPSIPASKSFLPHLIDILCSFQTRLIHPHAHTRMPPVLYSPFPAAEKQQPLPGSSFLRPLSRERQLSLRLPPFLCAEWREREQIIALSLLTRKRRTTKYCATSPPLTRTYATLIHTQRVRQSAVQRTQTGSMKR